jgi:hypothetical protein
VSEQLDLEIDLEIVPTRSIGTVFDRTVDLTADAENFPEVHAKWPQVTS